jgi:hypothetical protein
VIDAVTVAPDGFALLVSGTQLLPARALTAFDLGFHMVLVPFGSSLPLMMIVNYRALKKSTATP